MGRAAFAILLASEVARRRRTYALVAGVFLLATTGLTVLLGAVEGFEASVGSQLRDTLSLDARAGLARLDALGESPFFDDAHARAGLLATHREGAQVSPRVEFKALFLASDAYEDYQAGLLVGVDPARDPARATLPPLLVEGRMLDAENVWADGAPHPQLVVGEGLLARLERSVYEGGPLLPEHMLNVTSGRFSSEEGALRPVVRQGVVVGAFRTGFAPIDEGAAFVHLETARALLRMEIGDHANVLVVQGGAGDVRAQAQAAGLDAVDADAFRASYLEAVFVPLAGFTRIVLGVVLVLAGGWVAHVATGAVLADARRLAVLRAIGIPARLAVGPLALLVVAAAALGALLGLVAGRGVSLLLHALRVRAPGYEHLDLVAALPWPDALRLALAVLAVAVLAAGAALAALRRVPVTDALRA